MTETPTRPDTIDEAAQIAYDLILRRTDNDTELADIIQRGIHDAYRTGWNRSIAARPTPPVSSEQAETLRWAAKTLRGVPITATALTGTVWYGAGWEDAAGHLEDLADGEREA